MSIGSTTWSALGRVAVIGAGLTAAALVVLLVLGSSSQATSDGSPYSLPSVTDVNPDPNVIETTIVANESTEDIGPRDANAYTFNGSIPGPTFRAKVGDTLLVRFVNQLETEKTGIHWHGIELANNQDGTPFTQNQVEPGQEYLYKLNLDRPGIYWYHPHHHGSTNQVFKGLYGMILVEDPNENFLQANGTIPDDGKTLPLVLSDTTVCENVGANDLHTYNDNDDLTAASTSPWAGNAAANMLPHQPAPTPKELCQGLSVTSGGEPDPYPLDEDGNQRMTPFGDGDIPNIQIGSDTAGRVNEGQTLLTNGVNVGGRGTGAAPCCGAVGEGYNIGSVNAGASLRDVRPGQGIRFQLLNASTIRYMRLQLTYPDGTADGGQLQMRRIGGEGGLLTDTITEGGTQGGWVTGYTAGEILLPPGSRADVVAAIPQDNGMATGFAAGEVATLWTRDYDRTGLGFSNIATEPVAHLRASGSNVPQYVLPGGLRSQTAENVEFLPPPTANLLGAAALGPAGKLGTNDQNITLTQNGTSAGINGTFGTHDVPGDYKAAPHLALSSRYGVQPATYELTVENTTAANHPFHPHGFSIQPTLLDGPGAADFNFVSAGLAEFRDNIDVPAGYTLTYRVRTDQRPQVDGTSGGAHGRWVFHCHIFNHATQGMLSEWVIGSPGGNERPDVNVDDSFIEVPEGGNASVTGTFGDEDNNPVTLSTNEGSVNQTGPGTFSWSLATPTGPDRLVYITAVDSTGGRAVIPLRMDLPNVATPTALGTGAPAASSTTTQKCKKGRKLKKKKGKLKCVKKKKKKKK